MCEIMRIGEKHYWEKLELNLLSPTRHFGTETKINEITVCEQKLFQKHCLCSLYKCSSNLLQIKFICPLFMFM